MSRGYFVRQAAIVALAINARRPFQEGWPAAFAFFPGWLTSELAPQLLTLSASDTAAELVLRKKRSKAGLAIGAGAAGLLASLVVASRRTPAQVEEALAAGIGPDNASIDPNDLDASVPLSQILRPFHLKSPAVEVLRNISYTEGGVRACLDIYRRKGVALENAPVLFQIHGGGWTISRKEEQGLVLMNRMAERGWLCVAINYRLAPKHLWPKQIIDVKRALAWVHENIAEFGGDPDYIAVTGGSAGGHLTALTALADVKEWQPGFEDADTSVVAAVPFYGVYDIAGMTGLRNAVEMRDNFLGPVVFKKNPAKHLDDFVQASPLAHIGPDAPDFFVIHGVNDTLVSVRQARLFTEALAAQSYQTVTYLELPGAQHAFEVFSSIRSQYVVRGVQRWLEWHRAKWLAERSAGQTPSAR